MFYVLDYKLSGRTLGVGTTLDQRLVKVYQRCFGVSPANLSTAINSVTKYNIYILLEVFNEDHM